MNKFLFSQQNPFERLAKVRVSLCFMVILLLLAGPYDSFYVDTAPFLFHAKAPFPWFPNLGQNFWLLKYSVIFFGACFGMGIKMRITGPLFALLFFCLNYYVTCFGTTYWLTNTHLNFFAAALCLLPEEKEENAEFASFLLAFMITYVAVLYLQAGTSKLLLGGFEWFFTGQRIWTETILLGTPFGKWMTQWPWIFRMMGIGTGIFELFVPFLFFFDPIRRWAATAAIAFHLGTFLVMGISFWFLWALYPALFFPYRGERSINRSHALCNEGISALKAN